MMSRTHIAIALTFSAVSLILQKETGFNIIENTRELIPGAIIGATLPDMDTEKSWASQTIPMVDDLARKVNILRHRKLTHGLSGFFLISSIIVIFILTIGFNSLVLGLWIGYVSHILSDNIGTLFNLSISKHDKKIYNVTWIINVLLFIYIIIS